MIYLFVLCTVVSGTSLIGPSMNTTSKGVKTPPTAIELLGKISTSRSHAKVATYSAVAAIFSLFVTQSVALSTLAMASTAVSVHVSRSIALSSLSRQLTEAWPTVLDELRIRVTTLGQAIPQALFRSASSFGTQIEAVFADCERLWQLSGDFGLASSALDAALGDSASSSVLQTILLCHRTGGSDTEARIIELREIRSAELRTFKEAEAKLASVRFARNFVLVVPICMAVVGLAIGGGFNAYRTPWGIGLSIFAILILAGCWMWSAKLMTIFPTASKAGTLRLSTPLGEEVKRWS